MLFDIYENFSYKIGDRTLTLTDIFKSISFKDVETSNSFFDYYIQDGETPEIVSIKFYGTSAYSWLILLSNGIVDLKNGWFSSTTEFERKRELDYGGNAYYVAALPDIRPGDIMIKVTGVSNGRASGVTASVYQHVASFDPVFRKIRGICGAGTFQSGDNILFARKEENGNVTPLTFNDTQEIPEITDYTNILHKELYGRSVDYFYTTQNIVIDPYKPGISGASIPTYTTYTDPSATGDNFALTVIYKYGACGGVPVSGILKKEIDTGVYQQYIAKQKIRLLRPEYLPATVKLIRESLKSDRVGNTFKIEI